MYGGNKYDPDAQCSDKIKPGRDVDPKYFIADFTNETSETEMVEVGCVFSHKVEVKVSQPGSTVQWDYRTTGGAINFGVTIEHKVADQTEKQIIVSNCMGDCSYQDDSVRYMFEDWSCFPLLYIPAHINFGTAQ